MSLRLNEVLLELELHGLDLGQDLEVKFVLFVDDIFDISLVFLLIIDVQHNIEPGRFARRNDLGLFLVQAIFRA